MIEVNSNQLVSENYKSYSKYVLETRALPSVEDGLKLVQRRIIYAASKLPQKFMKTAALAGDVMKLHPHGESSGAIYTMSHPLCSQKIFNTKGNFGGYGWSPSAPRYTELYLNEIGRFNYCQFLEYAEYEEGELGIMEPKALPCLVPYGIIEGSSGMGVGISSSIIPLNLLDVVNCYKSYIKSGMYDSSRVRPDVGPYIIESDSEDVSKAVENPGGKISYVPIIVKESDTKVSIGRIPRSIDTVISKLGWWISDGYVEFTNESTSDVRYTFEIVNNKKGEITVDSLIYWIEKYCRSTSTYSRCMVDVDKSAIHCSLKYVMDSSLSCLDRAISKWIKSEVDRLSRKKEVYRVLKIAKDLKLFNDVSSISVDDLVSLILDKVEGSTEEVVREIVRKSISYLTSSHEDEEIEIEAQLDRFLNFDKKEYIYSLYCKFEDMVRDDYLSKKHTILKSEALTSPKVRLDSDGFLEIYQSRKQGYSVGTKTYLIGESGWIYIRSYDTTISCKVPIDIPEKIVGISTDKYKYLELQTIKGKKGVSFDVSSLDKEKYLVKLDEGEKVVFACGWNDPPEYVTSNLVTKQSKSRWY